jgi:hypothetical protein
VIWVLVGKKKNVSFLLQTPVLLLSVEENLYSKLYNDVIFLKKLDCIGCEDVYSKDLCVELLKLLMGDLVVRQN